jgi:alanine dehydrogenase
MRIGVPKEIKNNENRVGLTPSGAAALVRRGHEVFVEPGAGLGAGFADADYVAAGARLTDASACWENALVVKVKEPLESEYGYFGGQIVFTYFHLAGASPALTQALLASRTTAVAYETVEDAQSRLALLAPMSAVAGSMAPIVGSYYLAKFNQGRGTLLGELLGKSHGKVTIAGDGVVGQHAARVAAAMGARVVVLGRDHVRHQEIKRINPAIEYETSTEPALARHLPDSDLFIGAALIRGARTPHLVSEEMVRSMLPGSVIVDVSIDQGGCVATSRPTTHTDPVFVVHGVTHYCVTNMPGAYPRTATLALTDATLPYIERIAGGGRAALLADPGLAKGINTYAGFIVYRPVADALDLALRYRDLADLAGDAGAPAG